MSVLERARLAASFLADPRVGKLPRIAVVLALAYLVSPVDLVPELVLPVAGYLDDAVLLWMSVRWLFNRGQQVTDSTPTAKRLD